eukprot:TCONS_00029716-protein
MNRQKMETKCWKCFGVLQDEKVRFQEKQYHPRCYHCDICKKSLQNQICHEEGGKLYDKGCFNLLQQDKCSRCKTLIKSNGQTYRGKSYHEECFTCQSCRASLAGCRFHEDDGKFFHEGQCYESFNAYICNQCRQQINGNDIEFMMFQGKYFHNKCFACEECHQSLAGEKFKIMIGRRYCNRCR